MQPPMKYQPYKGYGGNERRFLWYSSHSIVKPPTHVRTRSDWRYRYSAPVCGITHSTKRCGDSCEAIQKQCRRCGRQHCADFGCPSPWKRPETFTGGGRWNKRRAHRLFRRAARVAIELELLYEGGDGVSHTFFIRCDDFTY